MIRKLVLDLCFIVALFVVGTLPFTTSSLAVVQTTPSFLKIVGVNSSTGIVIPDGIVAYLPITISNHQSVATPVPFQQQITIDSALYSKYENSALQNIEFFNSRGSIISSWLESGASSYSIFTVYWLKLVDGVPADRSLTIYMGFASVNANLFSRARGVGEAPSLSNVYGQYDDGAGIFTYYTNFSGYALPSSLVFSNQSNDECGSYTNASYEVNDDLIITAQGSPSGGCAGGAFFDTVNKYSPSVAEADLVLQTGPISVSAESYYPVAEWDTVLPSSFWGIDSGYAFDYRVCSCGTQIQIMAGNEGALASWIATYPEVGAPPTGIYGISWSMSGVVSGWQGYTNGLSTAGSANPYSPSHAGFGYVNGEPSSYSAIFDWFRIRAMPPNGVMPSVW